MKLECPPPLRGLVNRASVMGQSVPEEAAAWLERYHRIASHRNVCIANLPISPFEMDHRPFIMRTGDDVHASIFGRGCI